MGRNSSGFPWSGAYLLVVGLLILLRAAPCPPPRISVSGGQHLVSLCTRRLWSALARFFSRAWHWAGMAGSAFWVTELRSKEEEWLVQEQRPDMRMTTDKGWDFLQSKTGHHQGQDQSWAVGQVGQVGQDTEKPSSGFEWEQTDSVPDQSLSYLGQHLLRHQSCHLNQGSPEEKTEMTPDGAHHDTDVMMNALSAYGGRKLLWYVQHIFFFLKGIQRFAISLRGTWSSPNKL